MVRSSMARTVARNDVERFIVDLACALEMGARIVTTIALYLAIIIGALFYAALGGGQKD